MLCNPLVHGGAPLGWRQRGDGVADAMKFLDGAAGLIAAMRRPKRMAEQPELHLLPHLEQACPT